MDASSVAATAAGDVPSTERSHGFEERGRLLLANTVSGETASLPVLDDWWGVDILTVVEFIKTLNVGRLVLHHSATVRNERTAVLDSGDADYFVVTFFIHGRGR